MRGPAIALALILVASCAVELRWPEADAQALKPGGRTLTLAPQGFLASDSIFYRKIPCNCRAEFEREAAILARGLAAGIGPESTTTYVIPGRVVAVRRNWMRPSGTPDDTVWAQVWP